MNRAMNGWEMSEAITEAIRRAKQEVAQRCYEIAKESTAADDIAAKIAEEFRLKEKG